MNSVRDDFPIFSKKSEKPFVYFDSAATAQKPRAVLSALSHFYTIYNASINRGLYGIAERTTQAYEDARYKVARFINAQSSSEIVFTQGTTASINTVALIWARHMIQAGDEIVVSQMEHHSNFVPWQQLAQEKNATLVIIPVTPEGCLDLSNLDTLITSKTKLVAIIHCSNAVGTCNDLTSVIARSKKVGARILVDGAQAVTHHKIDVQALGCDFYAFSGHKLGGPTGIGVLYLKRSVHKECKPYQFGGGMIFEVTNEKTTFLPAPHCFEAGTPPIAQAIGLGVAIDYLFRFSYEEQHAHVQQLIKRLLVGLKKLARVTIIGSIKTIEAHGHLVSFTVQGIHAHDVAAYLDKAGICVRAGHFCAQPLAKALGYDSAVRISFFVYNTLEEVDYCLKVLSELLESK